jgi:tetratricopeptide (TPR) repeat protein
MFDPNAERNVIPRWRRSWDTVSQGELAPGSEAEQRPAFPVQLVDSRIAEWRRVSTIGFATDAISSALILGQPARAKDAAQFVLSATTESSRIARQVASRIIDQSTASDPSGSTPGDEKSPSIAEVRSGIRSLRRLLVRDPRNAVGWVDLARLYTILGVTEKAERALDAAIQLAPSNRFVLRAASRYFVHSQDPEHAIWILRKSPRMAADPWLLAAEIAISGVAKKESRFVRRGQLILADEGFSPLEVSELASAIATLQMNSGNRRIAKRYFAKSLMQPTENSIAQAEWAARRSSAIAVDPQHLLLPSSHEARAFDSFFAGNWSESLRSAVGWIADEPFSSRSVLFASFVASSMLEDYATSESLLQTTLKAEPDNPRLLNNLAFALASANRLEDAITAFRRIKAPLASELERAVWLATGGLIAFRSAQATEGRRLYNQAIELSHRYGFWYHCVMATVLLAREEVLARSLEAPAAVSRAESEVRIRSDKSLVAILQRVLDLRE